MEYIVILFFAVEIFLGYRYMRYGKLINKMAASVPFVVTGVYLTLAGSPVNMTYALLIVGGLVASFIGDWVLKYDLFGMKGLPGIAAFAIAHILYISAFAAREPFTANDLWLIFPWIGMLDMEIFLKKKLKIDLGATAPAVLIYAMIIDAMVILGIRAALLTIDGGMSVVRSLVLITGVIMFIVSDAGVCLMMFDGRKEITVKGKVIKLDPVNIFNYCGGQMLIAASVLL